MFSLLDRKRLANALWTARRTARSEWAIDYWEGVYRSLKRNIRVRNMYQEAGGSERISSLSKGVVWHR